MSMDNIRDPALMAVVLELGATLTTSPGQMIVGEGIFLGTWKPKDGDGNNVASPLDVFAAPEDLKGKQGDNLVLTLNAARDHVAGLRNWHGHDGRKFANDAALYNTLRDRSYRGEWVIPPRHLLAALYAHQNDGAFSGTFTTTTAALGSGCPFWYWSSTEYPENPDYVWAARFFDGSAVWDHRDYFLFSCRPVRLVPVSPP